MRKAQRASDPMFYTNSTLTSQVLPPGVLRIFGDLTFRTDGAILDLAASSDGTIWTVEAPGTVRRWNAEGRQTAPPVELSEVELLWAFNPDGTWLAAGSEELTVYETATGRIRFVRHQPAWVSALAFDPTGERLAVGHDDGQITVWQVHDPVPLESWPGHDSPISVLAFSPDGKTLASAGEDRRIVLWDAAAGRLLKVLEGHTDRIQALAWHPQGRILAAAGWDTMARIWDAVTGEPIILLNGHAEIVTAAVFSPDGRWLATADSDHLIWVWDFAAGKPVHRLRGHAGEVLALVFAPDGKLISGGEDRRVLLWDVSAGRALAGSAEPVRDMARIALRPDGQRLAYVNGSRCLWVWDPHSGATVLRQEAAAGLTAVAYGPNGGLLAIGDENGGISLIEGESGQLTRHWSAHKTAITDLAFRGDGSVLASSGATDGYVYLWNVADGEPRLLIPEATGKGTVERIAWVPNSPWLLACGVVWLSEGPTDGQICAWDIDLPGRVFALGSVATRLTVRPDGQQFATTDGSGMVSLWNLPTGRLERELDCESGAVVALAYSPDGRLLAAACDDGSIRLWDVLSLALVKRFELDLSPADLSFAPDGRTLYVANPGVLCYALQV